MGFDKCIQSCNHHHNQGIEYFCHSPTFLYASLWSIPSTDLQPLATTDIFSFPNVLFFSRMSFISINYFKIVSGNLLLGFITNYTQIYSSMHVWCMNVCVCVSACRVEMELMSPQMQASL